VSSRKILIADAGGFIGSQLNDALVRQGHEVRAFAHYNSFSSWGWLDHCVADVRSKLEVFQCDVRDLNGVGMAVKGCDSVLHLPPLITISYFYSWPVTTNSGRASRK
jgi:nucleoside-diphosphate-sugar epimerase